MFKLIKITSLVSILVFFAGSASSFTGDSVSAKDCSYGGKVKSAFAKIPMTIYPLGELFDSRNGLLQNLTHYDPPIERISKLKFKFRYHDGTLVDFQKFPFTFVVEFNQLSSKY